jgi:hypothetical protein
MTRTLSATLTAVVLLAACGGERRADTATQSADSAGTGASPAAPSDSAAQAAPTPSASADSAAQPAKPADTAAKSATAAKPAPKKTATAAPAPKKAAAPAPSAAAPAPSGDTTKAALKDTSSSEQADQPLRDAYHQAPKDTVDQATYDGWKQFNLNCARCHGEDVLGTTIAPHLIVSLKPDGPINTKELFMQTVCAGRPAKGMPAWCALGLDMNTINDIYLYVKGRSDAKISPGRPAVKAGG